VVRVGVKFVQKCILFGGHKFFESPKESPGVRVKCILRARNRRERNVREFVSELRRRHVIRATSYYLGAAWMLIGACDIFFPMFGLGDAVLRIVIWSLVGGIPIILGLSWVFEFSAAGVAVDTSAAVVERPARKAVDLVVVAILGGALTLSVFFNLRQDNLFSTAANIPLVAVVPFDDLSEVGRHMSLGLAEELLNLLVREPGIRVMSSANAFDVLGQATDLVAAAKDLDADFLVRGSVMSQGNEFRVIAKLIDVSSGEIVWSDDFVGKLSDVFVAQYTIANNVAESLNFAIEYAFSSDEGQLNTTAVDHYLRAKELRRGSGTLETSRSAQQMLENAITLQPDFSAALGELCHVHMAIYARTEDPADYLRSDEKCRQALQADPDSPYTQLALAALYNNGGEYQKSLNIAQQVTLQLPNYEPGYSQLGSTLWRLNDMAMAEQAFRHAVLLQDRDWRPYLALGNFYARNQRYEEAIEPFTKITELLPEDFIGYASLGVTHYEAGHYLEARELILRSLELNENSRSYFNLALIYRALEQPTEAAAAFRDALEQNPQNYRAQLFLAIVLEEKGDEEGAKVASLDALKIIEGLVEIDPNNAYVMANGANVLADLGESDRAIEWAERARRLNKDNPKTQFDIGQVYLSLGQQSKGIEDLATALAMGYPPDLFIVELAEDVLEHPVIKAALAANSAEPTKL
jgi:tetratricopeptide (TPR) repeat protein